MQVDSEQFGSQQVSRNYHLRGRILQVPSNYNPQTRQYSGIWDGTFKPAYSNNPAWCLWDMLTHPRYGMGKRLGAADVDKWALYVIGQYCDQSVPDGFGGTEPRITCNAYLTTQRKAWDVLSDFCSAMRCMPVWNGQTLTFVQDRPSDKVWTYNRSNVVMPDDGAPFRYSFSALKDRHNAVEVNWIDPNNGWETATELVEDTQAILRYGRNVTKMDAFGCTSRGQAHRAGLWLIKTELLETQTVDFSVGAEGLRHVPGDVIEICDDDYAGIRTGGRVLAVNSQTRTLTLDREITLPSSGTTLISCLTKSDNSRCRARFGKMSDNGAFVFHSDAVLDPVTGNVVHGNNVTVTAERVGEWWLFTATLFADAEMIISSRFEILAMPGISIIPNGSTLDIAMPQAEIGSYRTSFIITEGAPGTRSSDMVTIPVRNNIHRLPFSALVEVNKNWDIPPSKSPLIFNVKDYQENGLFTHGFRGNNFSDAGSPFISMGGCNKYVATTQRKIISGFRCGADGDVQAVCNGELSVAAKTTWTSIVPRAVLRIGGQGTNGEYHLFGHIRNLRIWHKELTDAQMGESIK